MKIAILFFALILNVRYQAPGKDKVQYLPDPKLTPGDSLSVSKDDLCKAGYKSSADDLTIAVKRGVFDRYVMSPTDVGYNVDHLIPIGLGGSDSVKNLWPQPLAGEWNYHMKNRLEKKLRKMVCSGELKLEYAQREIAADWVSAYRKYIVEKKRSPRR